MLVITGNKGNTATINVDPEVKFPLTELVDHIICCACLPHDDVICCISSSHRRLKQTE